MYCAQTDAPGVAPPRAISTAWALGKDRERDQVRIVPRGPDSSSPPPRRRRAWHKRVKITRRASALACARWFYETLPESERRKFVGVDWTPTPSRAAQLREHIRWRRESNLVRDRARWSAWRAILRECGGRQAEADLRMALERPVITRWKTPPSLEPSRDWFVRCARPDPALVEWMHRTHREWLERLTPEQRARLLGARKPDHDIGLRPAALRLEPRLERPKKGRLRFGRATATPTERAA